jgi:hypothetical protein
MPARLRRLSVARRRLPRGHHRSDRVHRFFGESRIRSHPTEARSVMKAGSGEWGAALLGSPADPRFDSRRPLRSGTLREAGFPRLSSPRNLRFPARRKWEADESLRSNRIPFRIPLRAASEFESRGGRHLEIPRRQCSGRVWREFVGGDKVESVPAPESSEGIERLPTPHSQRSEAT